MLKKLLALLTPSFMAAGAAAASTTAKAATDNTLALHRLSSEPVFKPANKTVIYTAIRCCGQIHGYHDQYGREYDVNKRRLD